MNSTSSVPFNDLSRTPEPVLGQIRAAIERVVSSGWYVMGPEHDAFQAELAEYAGVSDAVLLGNGTDALELALAALGVGTGDRVLTVANAGAYATTAARLLGAMPVFADVDPSTLLISPETLEAALARSPELPKALVVTHLYGAMADMPAILEITGRHGIPVVEDCAQSLGATLGGRKAGSFGDIATASFYPTKNLGALGDGGAVLSNRTELAQAVKRMRQYGWESKYRIGFDHGRNSRMDEMQAAILRVKLPLLDGLNDRRRAIHSRYEAVGDAVNTSSERFIAHLAVFRSPERDATIAQLKQRGVSTDIHYPVPDHEQRFPTDPPAPVSLPATEAASGMIYSVPMFPELTDDEVSRVCEALAAVAGK